MDSTHIFNFDSALVNLLYLRYEGSTLRVAGEVQPSDYHTYTNLFYMESIGVISVIVVAAFIFLRFRNGSSGAFKNIDAPTLRGMLKDKNVKIIDVRTPGEVSQGKIKHATNINVNSPDFKQKVSSLDKSKTYVVYCRSGMRSARACRMMSKAGFENLYNLQGGYMGYQNS